MIWPIAYLVQNIAMATGSVGVPIKSAVAPKIALAVSKESCQYTDVARGNCASVPQLLLIIVNSNIVVMITII